MGPLLPPHHAKQQCAPSTPGGTAQRAARVTCHPRGEVPSDGQAAQQLGGQFTPPSVIKVRVVSARE